MALLLAVKGQLFGRANLGAQVKRHFVAAGVERDGAYQLFRHAIATHLRDNGTVFSIGRSTRGWHSALMTRAPSDTNKTDN
ncbi:MAG: hypothetical protein ACR2RL_09155 [Gammaproteobacteria bacterium]